MKRIYVDTSALLGRYFRERESDKVIRIMQSPGTKMASSLVFVELSSALRRAFKGRRLTRSEHRRSAEAAREDLSNFTILPADEDLFRQAAVMADITALRTLDAIHLASAKRAGADEFVTNDSELAAAARQLGMKTL